MGTQQKKNNFLAKCLEAGNSAKNFQKNYFFVEVPPGRTLGKEFQFISLSTASRQGTRQRISKKIHFFAECREIGHSAKNFKKNNFFAECLRVGHSAKNFEKNILCQVPSIETISKATVS